MITYISPYTFSNQKVLIADLTTLLGEPNIPGKCGPRWSCEITAAEIQVTLHSPDVPGDGVLALITSHGQFDWRAPILKIEKEQQLTAERGKDIAAGVTYQGHVFASDETSAFRLQATIFAVQSGIITLPPGFVWRTQENYNFPVTIDDLKAIAGLIFANSYQAFIKSWILKDAL